MQKTIDLEDITGTGFIYNSEEWKRILAIVNFAITIFAYIVWIINEGWYDVQFAAVCLAPTIIPGILLIVSYIKSRTTLFFIEYAGGCVKFDASIYGLAESQDFEKQIRRAKNKVKETK